MQKNTTTNSCDIDMNYVKSLEKKLTESEKKFDILYNHASEMYAAVSPKDASIKFCNKTLCIKTGYSQEEIIGTPIFKFYHEDCMNDVKEAFNEFVSKGRVQNKQLILKCKNGKKIDVLLNVVAVRDSKNEILYSSSSWKDITEELTEKKIKIENDYLLSESQRMAHIGSWKFNLKDEIFSCSNEINNIFKTEQKFNSYEDFIRYVHPKDKQTVSDSFEIFLRDKQQYKLEYSLLLKNKEVKHIHASSEPVFDEDGNILSLIGAIQDITYIKNIQKELEEFNKNLEKKVEEKTESLKLAQEHLAYTEKMSSLGSLVAGISHEVNTPIGIGLTASSHFIKLTTSLKNEYEMDNMSEESFSEYLKTSVELSKLMNSNLKRAANLVKSFKQVAVDQTSEKKRTFILYDYIQEILASLHNITKQENLDIVIYCDKNLEITSYPGVFAQIFTNLILNTITHGIDKKENTNIHITISKEKNRIKIIYADDGQGIKKEYLSKIFDPFFTTNREKGGSGLGLNIVYNIIVNTLKGSIDCQSNENKGVKFEIDFELSKG